MLSKAQEFYKILTGEILAAIYYSIKERFDGENSPLFLFHKELLITFL